MYILFFKSEKLKILKIIFILIILKSKFHISYYINRILYILLERRKFF